MTISINPRTGEVTDLDLDASDTDVELLGPAVHSATTELARLGRMGRAHLLRSMSQALEAARSGLIEAAARETGLPEARLNGELDRTCYQFDLFARVLEEGSYVEAAIDHAGPTPMGPRPDLRRMLVPIGPVAVFGASNFPFAFSVAGGDTASALAAGCPVVAKAHSAHPETSVLMKNALTEGAENAGVRSPVVFLVFGQAAGMAIVTHSSVKAVGFTGSLDVGRMLYDVACSRPSPIPFYGELGALNTLTVCKDAAANRGPEIGAGLAASVTLGGGQFCTKPGLAFIPTGPGGDSVVDAVRNSVESMSSGVMLSERTSVNYRERTNVLRSMPGVTVIAQAAAHEGSGSWGSALVLEAQPTALQGELLDECFGPALVIVRYGSSAELLGLLENSGPALTATIHADDSDGEVANSVFRTVLERVGRVVWNAFPTGVAVSWAMHHGGPYPATTNPLHTSVGASSIRRWLRPISLQDVPDDFLPDELRETLAPDYTCVRRIDGVLVAPRDS